MKIQFENLLWANDEYYDINAPLTNFISPDVVRLTGPPRKRTVIDEIIVHETVTRNVPITIGVLKRRNLGVHFIIGPDGEITQHGDLLLDQLAHAGRTHNAYSIGIEIVNPYYPRFNVEGPWDTAIDARWAHKRVYLVPMLEQVESLYQLLDGLLRLKVDWLKVPKRWIGLDSRKQRFEMARVTRAKWHIGGIMAHTAFHHADGAWPLLYCILREASPVSGPEWAYKKAKTLGTTTRWYADLRGVL